MNLAKISLLSESAAMNANVVGYDFDNSLTLSESVSLAIAAISEACNEIDLEYVYGNELLMESAMFDGGKFDTLNEALGGNFVTSIKNFFKKIKEFLVGIVEKIKRQFALNTKNKSDFISKVKKELEKKGTTDRQNFTYTGYAWNSSFLSDPSLKLETLSSQLKTELAGVVDNIKDLKDIKDIVAKFGKTDKADVTPEKVKEKLASTLGVDFENVITDITKEARRESKDDIKGFEKVGVEAMLTFIDKSDDLVSKKVLKVYDNAKSEMDKLIASCEKAEKIEFKAETLPEDERDAARDAIAVFRTTAAADKTTVTFAINFAQTYANAVQSLAESASKEFMRVLKAYALTKPAK